VRLSKKFAAIAITATAALTATAAFAAWNASGAGSGSATARSALGLTTVDASVSPDLAGLYPGGTAQLRLSVHNSNPYSVSVTNVVRDPAFTDATAITVDGGHSGCLPSNVTFSATGTLATPVTVGATSTAAIPLAGTVHMINDADNSCQGAIFTIAVQASGVSNAS